MVTIRKRHKWDWLYRRVSELHDEELFALPWYFGAAWRDLSRREVVFLPVLLNVLAGLGRKWFWWLADPWSRENYRTERGLHEHIGRLERELLFTQQQLRSAKMAVRASNALEEATALAKERGCESATSA